MKLPAKVIAVIAVVVALAGAGLWAQRTSSSVRPVKLAARDMEVLFKDILRPEEQQKVASDPEGKKKLIDDVKKMFAVSQQAELEGYAEKLQPQLQLVEDNTLMVAYSQKHPGTKVSDDEIKAFYQNNPTAFDDLLKANPRFQQQAQGPNRENLRRGLAELRILSARARDENLDRDDSVRMKLLFSRSNVIASAYESELLKKIESETTDEEAQNYYNAHRDKFDQVQVSRIVISTEPAADDGHGHEDEEEGEAEKHQPLTPDQARQRAEQALARLRGGEDFAKVAAEVSDDPASKVEDGEGIFISKMNMQPEFKELVDTAFSLKPGEVSDVLEVQGTFYIIKVGERKPGPSPAENPGARQSIKRMIRDEKLQARIDDIVARSRVEIAEDFDSTPKPQPQPQGQRQ